VKLFIRNRLGLSGRLMLASVGALALSLAVLTAGFNLVLASRLDTDANSVAMTRATGELAGIKVTAGQISLPETPDAAATDAPTWVFDGVTALEQPQTNSTTTRAAAALVGGPRRFIDVPSTNTRLYALPVRVGGRRVGTVVSGVSLGPYEQTKRTALIASIALAALLLLTIAITARWLIAKALRPVAQMTRQAAAWSEHDLDRRFALGEPRDELTHLAATLDNLLGRLASSLRHEQRLTAELSHELRTPLTHIIAEAQHALRHARNVDEYRAGYHQILARANGMSHTLEALIAAARAELDPHRTSSDAVACARAAAGGCQASADASEIEIDVSQGTSRPRVAVEAQLVQRILAPLLENACRYATQTVHVHVDQTDTTIRYTIQDDGPGIDPQTEETLFEPGQRGAGHGTQTLAIQGAGLGLALARRLARTAGGEITTAPNDAGAKFVVQLPQG
jgi:two-component system, OmpR family, sensor kinase